MDRYNAWKDNARNDSAVRFYVDHDLERYNNEISDFMGEGFYVKFFNSDYKEEGKFVQFL
jgi:hypothetical protein